MLKTELNFLPTDLNHSISGIFSILATTPVIIYGIINIKKLQYIGKMVVFLNLADLLFCLTKLSAIVYSPPNEQYCKIIQTITQASLLLSAFWGAAFGHSFYIIMKYQQSEIAEKYYSCYLPNSFMFIVLGAATYFTSFVTYSPVLQTCVHQVMSDSIDYSYLFFDFIPIFACCTIGIVCYVKGIIKFNSIRYAFEGKNFLALVMYPCIMVVSLFPNIFLGLLSRFGYYNTVASTIVTNLLLLQGFLDAFVYGILPQIRNFFFRRNKYPENTSSIGSVFDSQHSREVWLLKSIEEEKSNEKPEKRGDSHHD